MCRSYFFFAQPGGCGGLVNLAIRPVDLALWGMCRPGLRGPQLPDWLMTFPEITRSFAGLMYTGYFRVSFLDQDMAIPELVPLVFIGEA
jgi:hypothetical protein